MSLSKVRIGKHPYKGRCFVATETIFPGELVLVAKPLGLVPDDDNIHLVCSYCLQPPGPQAEPLKVACKGGCGQAHYCDEVCRQMDWDRSHSFECPALVEYHTSLKFDTPGSLTEVAWLLIRILANHAKCLESGDVEPEGIICESATSVPLIPSVTFKDVWKLCTNSSGFPVEKLQFEFACMALCLSRLLALYIYPKLQGSVTAQYPTPQSLIPPCDDRIIQDIVAKVLQPTESTFKTRRLSPDHPLLKSLIDTIGLDATKSLMASTMELLCKEECNSFGVYTFTKLGHCQVRQGYAIGLYPSVVYYNHSCAPNVGHVTRRLTKSGTISQPRTPSYFPSPPLSGSPKSQNSATTSPTAKYKGLDEETMMPGAMAFFAVDKCEVGDELCISYVPILRTEDTAGGVLARRSILKNVFFFDCDCDRCKVEMMNLEGGCKSAADLDIAKNVQKYMERLACGLDGCKAFLVPANLNTESLGSGSKSAESAVDNVGSAERVSDFDSIGVRNKADSGRVFGNDVLSQSVSNILSTRHRPKMTSTTTTTTGPVISERTFRTYRGLALRAKTWGVQGVGRNVLALHGWLDNAATWDHFLAGVFKKDPKGFYVVGLDLPGHGFSDHRSVEVDYLMNFYVEDVCSVIEALGWTSLIMLGHSMGGAISTLVCAMQSAKITHLVAVEALGPYSSYKTTEAEDMEIHLKSLKRKGNKKSVFPTVDDAVTIRMNGIHKLSREAAIPLVARGIMPAPSPPVSTTPAPSKVASATTEHIATSSDDFVPPAPPAANATTNSTSSNAGFIWSSDSRLMAPTSMKYRESAVFSFLSKIECPVLSIWGHAGIAKDFNVEGVEAFLAFVSGDGGVIAKGGAITDSWGKGKGFSVLMAKL
ncbi:hypothetical protein HDU76_003819 [Blyttiomyces sp. JEL0837]|nr:hypothetical protein HDU76_003819 [Blyttiomyces sp. JEL0837]